jgi:hypothetical protein
MESALLRDHRVVGCVNEWYDKGHERVLSIIFGIREDGKLCRSESSL